jgi:phosphoribosylformylglycinamidine cyclo-ligase
VSDEEMLRTFNCGIGMVIAIAADDADTACSILENNGESPVMIGRISDGNQNVVFGAQ